jgi:hypothetical protein
MNHPFPLKEQEEKLIASIVPFKQNIIGGILAWFVAANNTLELSFQRLPDGIKRALRTNAQIVDLEVDKPDELPHCKLVINKFNKIAVQFKGKFDTIDDVIKELKLIASMVTSGVLEVTVSGIEYNYSILVRSYNLKIEKYTKEYELVSTTYGA